MNSNYEKRFNELESNINELIVKGEFEQLVKFDMIYKSLSNLNKSIRKVVVNSGFYSKEDEIHFFKNIKPNIFAWLKALNYIKSMESKFVNLDNELIINILNKEHEKCNRYLINKSDIALCTSYDIEFDMLNFTQLSKKKDLSIYIRRRIFVCIMP